VWVGRAAPGRYFGYIVEDTVLIRHTIPAGGGGYFAWLVSNQIFAINAGFGWLKEEHLDNYPLMFKNADGTWRHEKVVGGSGRFHSAAFYLRTGGGIGTRAWQVNDGRILGGGSDYHNEGPFPAFVEASSEVWVSSIDSIDLWSDSVSYTTFDVAALRADLAARNITDVASATLVFWITGYHYDYLWQRDGDDDNLGTGWPSDVLAVHFGSAVCPVTAEDDVGDGPAYHVTGAGVRGADLATVYTYMGDDTDTTVAQLVEVDVDLDADHMDFTLWLDPLKDDPPPGPPLLDLETHTYWNFAKAGAGVALASVIIQTNS
jgi:hypothetical protein